MNIEFIVEALVGTRIYNVGEQVTFEDAAARLLIIRGVAKELISEVREATDKSHKTARKAAGRKPS